MRHFASSIRRFIERANEWFTTKEGGRFRMILFGTTVVTYPVGILLLNGPLLKFSFPRINSVDYDLPEHVKATIEEQYNKWLEHENRAEKNAYVKFSCQNNAKKLDSIATGSLSVRFGAQVALPFFARFKNDADALEYCEKHFEPFNYCDKIPLCIIWESKAGRELLSTFVLSQKALKFLIARDLFGNDGYNAYSNKAITWATWTMFSSVFTYWIHSRFTKGSILSFAAIYTIFIVVTFYACHEWHYLYKHMNNCNSDKKSARLSLEHSEGGKEYYTKLLKRNRILRSLMEKDSDRYISTVGDERGAITPYFVRFELLKDIVVEDDEIKPILAGDVF